MVGPTTTVPPPVGGGGSGFPPLSTGAEAVVEPLATEVSKLKYNAEGVSRVSNDSNESRRLNIFDISFSPPIEV